jgi:hypothetical protein
MSQALTYNSPAMVEGQRQAQYQNRPTSVTLVNWGVFLFGLANGWRAIGLFRQSGLLLELEAALNPLLQMILALIWAGIFLANAVVLRRGWPSARITTPALILVFALYQLVYLRAFYQTPETRNGGLAIALLYGLAVLFTIWALNRRSARVHFDG